ncbi:MAG: VPLPA-CTERM sorting domain-containing protein [Gammaproteobacteria bacterium]|nr:VPLPA-CTERM sorting domain-containing protein [Gammaproteobacteria bacterium]
MLKNLTVRLALASVLALSASAAMAASAIDTFNPANGLTDIYSTSFDPAQTPCGGGSPSYCAFFGGDAPIPRAIVLGTNPSGVMSGVPGGIAGPPAAGSFLDVSLSAGNTLAQIVGASTIRLAPATLIISGVTTITTSGAGFVILPSGVASVNGLGQVEFLVNNDPLLAADFSTLGAVVTGCVGPHCALLGGLTLDMVRYRLFLDFDPTFTSFTGSFIGQTSNGSMVSATLNSPIPIPAAAWLMASGLGVLGALRRRAKTA